MNAARKLDALAMHFHELVQLGRVTLPPEGPCGS